MHQSVIHYDALPTLTANAPPAQRHRHMDALHAASAGLATAEPTPSYPCNSAPISSYFVAASIAAALVVAWAGLCII